LSLTFTLAYELEWNLKLMLTRLTVTLTVKLQVRAGDIITAFYFNFILESKELKRTKNYYGINCEPVSGCEVRAGA